MSNIKVQSKRKIQLDSAFASVCRCMLYRCKMTAGRSYSLHGPIAMLHLFCYIFAHEFFFNPNSILNLTISYESQSFTEFNDTFCVGKCCQLFTHKSIVDQYAISALYSPPNCPFPFDDYHQNLIHPYRALPHSPPQTTSWSNLPCCHCSHVRTDRWEGRMFDPISAPLNRAMR